ncbi:putative clathrin assembly protein [Hordeum vulgare]|nr:putative clathrin assembly protein [Hordeum vulgare]
MATVRSVVPGHSTGCSDEEKVLLQDVLHPSPASTSYSTHDDSFHFAAFDQQFVVYSLVSSDAITEPRMAGGGTSIRKYVGALKDSTTVSIAKVNNDYKQLDIAIVKATNHVEGLQRRSTSEVIENSCSYMEEQEEQDLSSVENAMVLSMCFIFSDIFMHLNSGRARANVAYCIRALARCLSKMCNLAVALKTLIMIHRALREVDPSFREKLISYGTSSGEMLHMSYFKDDSSPNGILEPIKASIRDATLGVGKQEQDDFFTSSANFCIFF